MKKTFIDWLPDSPIYRFLAKQAVIFNIAFLIYVLRMFDYSMSLIFVGALILVFRFLLLSPTNEELEPKKHPRQKSTEGNPNSYGVLNHALIVGFTPIIVGFIMSAL